MLWRIKTVGGQKQKIAISNPAPQGYPVGTIIMRYKKICPRNCVYLDGRDTTGTAEELETVYPALYMFLGGTNVLPDYRECAMVGAERNTTDTIASHDVYTEGEFKDDQMQNHTHDLARATNFVSGGQGTAVVSLTEGVANGESSGIHTGYRTGTTTHGKQKAVYYYMVAVEGCMIADEDDFINVIKNYIDTTTPKVIFERVSLNGSSVPTYTFDTSNYSSLCIDFTNYESSWGGCCNYRLIKKNGSLSLFPLIIQHNYVSYAISGNNVVITYIPASGGTLVNISGNGV